MPSLLEVLGPIAVLGGLCPVLGIAPARAPTDEASARSDEDSFKLEPAVLVLVREHARWFFWIAALLILDSVFTTMGSHPRHSTRFGVIAMIDNQARSSDSIGRIHLIVNGWLAAVLILVGCCAPEGHKWAFVAGMAAFFLDGTLLVAAGDFLGAAIHIPILYGIYLRVNALNQQSRLEND